MSDGQGDISGTTLRESVAIDQRDQTRVVQGHDENLQVTVRDVPVMVHVRSSS
jgi:hypothetical protein